MPTTTPLFFGSYRELAAEIAQRLLAARGRDPLAPWSEDVIAASAGVASEINRRIAESEPAFPSPAQPLEMLALRIVNAAGEFPRIANDAERRLAMRMAARSVADPLMETHGTAAMLERTYRDIRDSGITIREFARKTASAPVRNRERVRTLIRAWDEYERLITKLGCIDPADLLSRAAALILEGAAVRMQVVAGFYDMTGAQMQLISALRAVERLAAVYVPLHPHHPRAYAFGRDFVHHFVDDSEVPAHSPSLPIRQPAWTITEHRTREDEMRALCATVRRLLDTGVSASDIGIVSRSLDPYDLHLLHRFASESGFTPSAPLESPLVAHRIGRAVAMLLRLRERDFPRSEILEIARSGLRVESRINADKADVETRRVFIAGGSSATLRTRKTDNFAVNDYISLVAELEALTEKIDGHLIARLADSFRIDHDSDLEACAQLDAIADLFTRAEAWNRKPDVSSILDAIEQATIRQPATGSQQPVVWTGDIMRLRGRSFEHLFAVRMQDDMLPQRRNEDPLLPDSDRRLAGVREIGNGRDEEQLLFELMRSGSPSHVHFSYAASDGFGKPLRPSHYLKTFALEQRPDDKDAILKQFSRWVTANSRGAGSPAGASPPERRRHIRPLQLLARAGSRSAFDGYITSEPVLARARAALESMSPTHLENFGECPQKFLFKHILKVHDFDDPEREVQINHREKGSLDHRILERFYRSLTPDDINNAAPALPQLHPALANRLDSIINAAFDEFEENAPAHNPAMRAIERRATLRVLRRFIAADFADLVANGLMPTAFEYRFGKKHKEHIPDHPEPFIVDVDGVALRVEGTIDRIDRGGGTLRIVDYKSGKALRHEDLATKIDRGVRLQLALYAMAAAEFFRSGASEVYGAIKPIAATDTPPDKFAFSLGDKETGLRETLQIFVRAILRGAFPAFPNENDREFNSCKYCPVNHSCRARHDVDERRLVLNAREPRTLLQS